MKGTYKIAKKVDNITVDATFSESTFKVVDKAIILADIGAIAINCRTLCSSVLYIPKKYSH